MMRTLKISPKNFKDTIKETAKSIKKGEIVVCPTDTVYGFLADAANKKPVKKIFEIKKREKVKPIPIFVKNIQVAKKLAYINKKQESFLKKIWPGKITVVLKRRPDCDLPRRLFGSKKTIGLRIPNYKLINILLKELNKPLTGTSANISGKPASTKIKEVLKQFENKKHQPDLIIDAGNLPKSLPSTIIDLTKQPPKILRERDIKNSGNCSRKN